MRTRNVLRVQRKVILCHIFVKVLIFALVLVAIRVKNVLPHSKLNKFDLSKKFQQIIPK